MIAIVIALGLVVAVAPATTAVGAHLNDEPDPCVTVYPEGPGVNIDPSCLDDIPGTQQPT